MSLFLDIFDKGASLYVNEKINEMAARRISLRCESPIGLRYGRTLQLRRHSQLRFSVLAFPSQYSQKQTDTHPTPEPNSHNPPRFCSPTILFSIRCFYYRPSHGCPHATTAPEDGSGDHATMVQQGQGTCFESKKLITFIFS